MSARLIVAALLASGLAGAAAAQMTYAQCADRARDRYMRGQATPTIGPDRALEFYTADLRECVRLDAQNRAQDARSEQQRVDQQRVDQLRADQRRDQQRLDQLRDDQLREQQRLDQQRLDQQRADQQRLDQQRARQRDDMYRSRRY